MLSHKQRSFVDDAIAMMTSKAAVIVLSAITGIILARVLGPEDRGLYAAIIVIPTMFISLTNMGVRQSAIHFIGKKVFPIEKVMGAVYLLAILVSVVGITVCTLIMTQLGNPNFSMLLIILAVTQVPLLVTTSYSEGIFLGNRLVGVTAKISWMVEALRLVFVIILVYVLELGVRGALMALLACQFLTTTYAISQTRLVGKISLRWDSTIVKSLFSKGIIFALALFVMQLNYKVDILLMERLCPLKQIGLYAVGVNIAQLMWIVPQGVTAVLFSHSANAENIDEFSYKVTRLLRVVGLFSFLLMMTIVLVVPFAIPFVYGNEYSGSVRVMQLLAPGVFAMFNFKIINQDLAGRGRPDLALIVTIPGLVINIILNLFLLPRYGAVGAAISSSISYSLVGVGFLYLYSYHCKIKLRDIFKFKRSDFLFLRQLKLKLKSIVS